MRPLVPAVLTYLAFAACVVPAGAETDQGDRLRKLFVLSNTEFVLLHEFAHLIIHEFDLPVLGNEEDAADRIAAVTMILRYRLDKDERELRRLLAVTSEWLAEWEEQHEEGRALPFWDAHALDIQRAFTILCLVSGSNPDKYSRPDQPMLLPLPRGWDCSREFNQARRAMEWVAEKGGRKHGANEARTSGRVRIRYEEASGDPAEMLLAWLMESGVAESAARYLETVFAFPRDLTVVFKHGPANAYSVPAEGKIIFCYELMERYLRVGNDRIAEIGDPCGISSIREHLADEFGCPVRDAPIR